jgi:long-chain acyl-CoA synthetase
MSEVSITTNTVQIYKEKGDTWPKILKYNFEKYGDKHIAMRHKQRGIWKPFTWKDYYTNVKYLSLGFISLGLKPGDKVIIIGDNAPQWYYAELAAQAGHGVAVGVYSDLTPSEIKYLAVNSDAAFAIVEDQEQVDKFLEIKNDLPLLKKVIYWDHKGLSHYDNPILMGYQQVLEVGKQYDTEHRGLFEQNIASGNADDVCALIYTSGTTGPAPKGAIHTYKTMKAGAECYLNLDPWYESDNIVPYLPPAWMTEQLSGIGCHLLSASILNFAEEPETQQDDTREIGPSIVFYGARLWESQAATVHNRNNEADSLKRFVFRSFMPVGYKIADMRSRKEKPGILQRILYGFTHLILFRPIRDSLGLTNARICYTTDAILSPNAFRFYHALNLPLKSLYGSTEGGPVAGAGNDDIRIETIGPAHKGVEVKITDNGEIVYRQAGTFNGYYKDPEKTAKVLKDGWYYSGDSGFIADNGHLVFTDRTEDVVTLAGGEKLAPQFLESRLRYNPHIKDAWIVAGPNNEYASAVIVIDYKNVGRWAGHNRVSYDNFVELSQKPEVYQLIKRDIDSINQDLPQGLRIRKFVNLDREFEAELTRNRKLRRTLLKDRYKDIIHAIYSDKDNVSIEINADYRDKQKEEVKTTVNIESV